MDTPLDTPARTRFARFRGLKSFRTSPWHKQENLPSEYARIYQVRMHAAVSTWAAHVTCRPSTRASASWARMRACMRARALCARGLRT